MNIPFPTNYTSERHIFYIDLISNAIIQKVSFDLRMKSPISPTSSEFTAHISQHLFFMTVQTRYSASSFNQTRLKSAYTALHHSVSMISNRIVTRANERNAYLQPLMLTCLDAEASRYSTFSRDIQIPHFHAYLLLHPKTLQSFSDFLDTAMLQTHKDRRMKLPVTSPLETITFSRFDPAQGSFEKLTTYISKFARNEMFNDARSDLSLFDVYPKLPAPKYPFYARHPELCDLNL